MINPWTSRFKSYSREEIFENTLQKGSVLSGLDLLSTQDAKSKLLSTLKCTFYPTEQSITILQELLDRQKSFCSLIYDNKSTFISNINSGNPSSILPQFGNISILSGWAGTGKSSLSMAFKRLQPKDSTIDFGEHCGKFPLKSFWSVDVLHNVTVKDLLTTITGLEGTPRNQILYGRSQAYRAGISTLIVDEFQNANQGAANAHITKLLFLIGYLGLQTLVIANISLLQKLVKRPHEDQHRLLSDPIFLMPESRNSEGWINTIMLMQESAPEAIPKSVENMADLLHRFTFGINRNLVFLLINAYEISRNKNTVINEKIIEEAFKSIPYHSFRRDVDALTANYITSSRSRSRNDLWSPIEMPTPPQTILKQQLEKDRNISIGQKMLESSMTENELVAHKKILSLNKSVKKKSTGDVVQFKTRKAKTSDELAADTADMYSKFL